jgi:hypothetical protein
MKLNAAAPMPTRIRAFSTFGGAASVVGAGDSSSSSRPPAHLTREPSPIRQGHRANRTRIDGHAARLINRSAGKICVSNGPLLGNCQALD